MGLRYIRPPTDSFTTKAEIVTHFLRKVSNWFMIGLRTVRQTSDCYKMEKIASIIFSIHDRIRVALRSLK